jgi:eukaryotic-like serine/threonine-protein kinase
VDLALARSRFEDADRADPYAQRQGLIPAYLLAELSAHEGDAAATVAQVRRYQAYWPRGVWRAWAWPRSLLLLAQAEERLGDLDAAKAALDRFDALWRDADGGLPPMAESRKLRQRLESRVAHRAATGRTR